MNAKKKKRRNKETKYIKYLLDREFCQIKHDVEARQSEPFRACLFTCAYGGLRVSDATALKTDNVQENTTRLVYVDKKTGILQNKLIPRILQKILRTYIKRNQHRFKENYLFPPDRTSKNPHLLTSTFRDFFKQFRRKHGYDKPYHITQTGKPLYRISMHTLKHYCAYKLYEASGRDAVFVQDYLGHVEMKHTLRYIRGMRIQIEGQAIINRAFG